MSIFSELRRRNVFRVAGTYAVVAWLLIQVASAVSEPLGLPTWFEAFVIMLLAIGFPVALVLAWAFEITPDGIKVTQSQGDVQPSGFRWLDFALIAALVAVAGVTVWSQLRSTAVDPAAHVDKPSIAVLPFDDMSPDKDQEYFGDGIAEELLNELARLDGLHVAGRTSSFAYKYTDKDIREIGRALNVRTVLEGSVRKSGDRIRITAQLINAEDGYHLWSEVFDRQMKDIFTIQQEIATSVAGALGVRLGVGDANAFLGAGTRNVEAYEAFLKGWSFVGSRDDSILNLETAVRLDPNYAAAWAALGLHTAATQWSSNAEEAPAILDRAFEYVQRAVELDPNSGASRSLLGTIQYARFDWAGGEESHRQALQLRSDRSGHEQYGNLLMRTGRVQAASFEFDTAIREEPQAGSATNFGWAVSMILGDFPAAKSKLSELYEGREPGDSILLIAMNERDRDKVLEMLGEIPPNSQRARTIYGPVLQNFDNPELVLQTLRDLDANEDIRWPSKYHDIAMWAAYFGDAEFALQTLERELRYTAVRLQTVWYPLMSAVRQQPEFRQLMRDIGLVDYWKSSGWADFCKPINAEEFSCS